MAFACISIATVLAFSPATNTLSRPHHALPVISPARCTRAVLADSAVDVDEALLGSVLSVSSDGLIAVKPEDRELAKVGTMLRFGGGGIGTIISERCGLYFASSLEGPTPAAEEPAVLLPRNLTVPAWDGDAASWGGLHDYLGRRVGGPAKSLAEEPDEGSPDVFGGLTRYSGPPRGGP